MNCPYCSIPAEWVSNAVVYGTAIGNSHMIWRCPRCEARVGCHHNTQRPLGTMANAELRSWRMRAHNHIDPLWRTKQFSRRKVYKLLSRWFGEPVHIGQSDIEVCKQIISIDLTELVERYK